MTNYSIAMFAAGPCKKHINSQQLLCTTPMRVLHNESSSYIMICSWIKKGIDILDIQDYYYHSRFFVHFQSI